MIKGMKMLNRICFVVIWLSTSYCLANGQPQEKRMWSCYVIYGARTIGSKPTLTRVSLEGVGLMRCRHIFANKMRKDEAMEHEHIEITKLDGEDELSDFLKDIPPSYEGYGETFEVPIELSFSSWFFTTLNLGKFHMQGRIKSFSLVSSPKNILGVYKVFHSMAAVPLGVGGFLGGHLSKEGIKVLGSFSLGFGLGVQAGYSTLSLALLEPSSH